jgi:hypothetical protein
MKLSSMLLLLVILQVTIMFYWGLDPGDDFGMEAYEDNETVIWHFVTDPTDWKLTPFLILLFGLGILGTSFIVVGIFISTPSDTAIFSPVFGMLLAAGAVPIISLYQVFRDNYLLFGCEIDTICSTSLWVWILTGGIIGLFYVLSVIEWWSGRSMG